MKSNAIVQCGYLKLSYFPLQHCFDQFYIAANVEIRLSFVNLELNFPICNVRTVRRSLCFPVQNWQVTNFILYFCVLCINNSSLLTSIHGMMMLQLEIDVLDYSYNFSEEKNRQIYFWNIYLHNNHVHI